MSNRVVVRVPGAANSPILTLVQDLNNGGIININVQFYSSIATLFIDEANGGYEFGAIDANNNYLSSPIKLNFNGIGIKNGVGTLRLDGQPFTSREVILRLQDGTQNATDKIFMMGYG